MMGSAVGPGAVGSVTAAAAATAAACMVQRNYFGYPVVYHERAAQQLGDHLEPKEPPARVR